MGCVWINVQIVLSDCSYTGSSDNKGLWLVTLKCEIIQNGWTHIDVFPWKDVCTFSMIFNGPVLT